MDMFQILMLFTIFMFNPFGKRARTKRATPIEAQSSRAMEEENFESDEEEAEGDEEDEDDDEDDTSDEEDDAPPRPWGQPQWLAMYAQHMTNRKIRVERAVKISTRPKVDNQLITRNWLGIGDLNNPCYDELVKWFYASAIKIGKSRIIAHVRGVQVMITPKIISDVIGAPSVIAPTYPVKNLDLTSNRGKRFFAKVVKEVTNGRAVNFSKLAQGTLTTDYRFLHATVTHNFLPVGRFSTVTWERGLFMYCVMNGYTIDLPQVMFDHIASFLIVQRTDTDQLPFGTLISKICIKAGVTTSLADFTTPKEKPIGFKGYNEPVGSSSAPSSSTTAAGSVQEGWMSQPPVFTPMSACSTIDELSGALSSFKMEQNAANQYMYRYLDAIYHQRSSDDHP